MSIKRADHDEMMAEAHAEAMKDRNFRRMAFEQALTSLAQINTSPSDDGSILTQMVHLNVIGKSLDPGSMQIAELPALSCFKTQEAKIDWLTKRRKLLADIISAELDGTPASPGGLHCSGNEAQLVWKYIHWLLNGIAISAILLGPYSNTYRHEPQPTITFIAIVVALVGCIYQALAVAREPWKKAVWAVLLGVIAVICNPIEPIANTMGPLFAGIAILSFTIPRWWAVAACVAFCGLYIMVSGA
jgi:hypothetical protein